MAQLLPAIGTDVTGVYRMANYSGKTSVEDAKLDPTESTGRGVGISITTWIMILVFAGIVLFGALMIGGFLGPGMRNQPVSNGVAKP